MKRFRILVLLICLLCLCSCSNTSGVIIDEEFPTNIQQKILEQEEKTKDYISTKFVIQDGYAYVKFTIMGSNIKLTNATYIDYSNNRKTATIHIEDDINEDKDFIANNDYAVHTVIFPVDSRVTNVIVEID